MHRYLHLPVVSGGESSLEGLVDVLGLTYSTLEMLNSLEIDTGPVWERCVSRINLGVRFWNTLQSREGSETSARGKRHPLPPRMSAMSDTSVNPGLKVFLITR